MFSRKIGILDPEGKYKNPLTGTSYSQKYKDNAKKWSNLPIYKDGKAEWVIKIIKDNRVVILEAGTGVGKTVCVPKYALHVAKYTGKVIVTVPKQVLANNTATRDAEWLDVTLGEEVGYKYRGAKLSEEMAEIKGDFKAESDNTKLLFCTDGSLVAMLSRDPTLSQYSVVVIDEAHERTTGIDEALLYIRRALRKNSKLKLIVMSATLPNSDQFLDYFDEFSPAHIDLPGAPNKPVELFWLKGEELNTKEEKEAESLRILFEEIIEKNKPGDVLIFVNSKSQGVTLAGIVESRYPDIYVGLLYSGVPDREKDLATEPGAYKEYTKGRPKEGWSRRVVFATNVAESSLTVEGLIYVIDQGTEFSSDFNSLKQQSILRTQMITRAQADQRKGRVGRREAGFCYRLYTEKQFMQMKDRPDPSIEREDMTMNFLKYLSSPNIKNLVQMVQFVGELIEPPSIENIRTSIRNLVSLSLVTQFTKSGLMTEEGKFVSEIVTKGKLTDVNIGKAILIARYCNCEKTVIIIAAIIKEIKFGISDFFFTKTKDPKIKEILKYYFHPYGDLFSFLKLFIQYNNHYKRMDRKQLQQWAKKENVKLYVLENIQNNAKEIYNSTRNILEKIEVMSDFHFKNDNEAALFSLSKGYFTNTAKLVSKGKRPKYTNLYPPVTTTASYDQRGDSYLSMLDKPPKYIFYIQNTKMDKNITFKACNVYPEDMFKLLNPEEKITL